MSNFLIVAILLLIHSLEVSGYSLPLEYTFSKDAEGWVGDFADYPVDQEGPFELSWGWENLPTPMPISEEKGSPVLTKGLFLSGNNHSDDLFMFVKTQIRGLKPSTEYALTFSVVIESNLPPGMAGIGGAPGESVYFKIGASAEEPVKKESGGQYALSVDKGSQSEEGKCVRVVGNLANEAVDPRNPQYRPKQLSNEMPLLARTDKKGRLWIFVGTDSGFEGVTKYYIAQITLFAQPLEATES